MKDLAVILANDFEDIEALTMVDFCRRAGVDLDMISIEEGLEVRSAHQVRILADKLLKDTNFDDYGAIFIPGGLPGAETIRDQDEIIYALDDFKKEGKLIASICAGPAALDRARVLTEGKFTCFPGYEGKLKTQGRLDEVVVEDGNVITALGPAAALELAFTVIERLRGEKVRKDIEDETQYTRLLKDYKK